MRRGGRYDIDNKQSLVVDIKKKTSELNLDRTMKGGATLKTEGTVLNFDNLKENNTDECHSKKMDTHPH